MISSRKMPLITHKNQCPSTMLSVGATSITRSKGLSLTFLYSLPRGSPSHHCLNDIWETMAWNIVALFNSKHTYGAESWEKWGWIESYHWLTNVGLLQKSQPGCDFVFSSLSHHWMLVWTSKDSRVALLSLKKNKIVTFISHLILNFNCLHKALLEDQ